MGKYRLTASTQGTEQVISVEILAALGGLEFNVNHIPCFTASRCIGHQYSSISCANCHLS